MSPNEILAWSGLAIGVAFGALGQSTGFCLNRAVKDYVESKNLLKARSFALAMLVAIVGAQLLAITGLIFRLLSTAHRTSLGCFYLWVRRCLATA